MGVSLKLCRHMRAQINDVPPYMVTSWRMTVIIYSHVCIDILRYATGLQLDPICGGMAS